VEGAIVGSLRKCYRSDQAASGRQYGDGGRGMVARVHQQRGVIRSKMRSIPPLRILEDFRKWTGHQRLQPPCPTFCVKDDLLPRLRARHFTFNDVVLIFPVAVCLRNSGELDLGAWFCVPRMTATQQRTGRSQDGSPAREDPGIQQTLFCMQTIIRRSRAP
jgi:hypothetical protein